MIIFTGEEYPDGTRSVLCSYCFNHIGRVAGDEIAAYSAGIEEGICCFNCDTVGADMVHPALLSEIVVTDTVSDGVQIVVFRWGSITQEGACV